MGEAPHTTAVKKQWKLKGKAEEKRTRFVDGKLETYASPLMVEIDGATMTRAEAEEMFRNPKVGQKMLDGTFYLGEYVPVDRAGNSLGKTFNAFAAPQDLPQTECYGSLLEYVAHLDDWHGYDAAAYYTTEVELNKALVNGAYKGEWVIPPRELVDGRNKYGDETTPDNFLAHMDKGAFKDTFRTSPLNPDNLYDNSDWYWALTAEWGRYAYKHFGIQLSSGDEEDRSANENYSCRLVRFEPKP